MRQPLLRIALLSAPAVIALSVSRPCVDLRSDTVTTPTEFMRAAMASAAVGDDVFGDDPTVGELERRVAGMFGKEAAMFVPSGTMGNLIALMSHCWERGSEYIIGDQAHAYIFEQGGVAQFGGAHPRVLATLPDGTIGDAAAVCAAIRASDQHFPVTKVVALENTHNLCGGKVLTTEYAASVAAAAHEHGVAMHLDGARVWHAAEALGESLEEVARPFDSLSVCLSKAVGAPAGSLVVGSEELIRRGRRLRKGLGGTMRQTGVLAAAGLAALDEVLPRIANDHAAAARLAAQLSELGFVVEPPQTNLLYFSLAPGSQPFTASELVAACGREGVRFLCVPGDPNRMRMVTHHQIGDAQVESALEVIGKVCAAPDLVTATAAPLPTG